MKKKEEIIYSEYDRELEAELSCLQILCQWFGGMAVPIRENYDALSELLGWNSFT